MLFDESLLTFSQAAAALPAIGGKRPHASSLWRWSKKGVQGIRLECRQIGGRLVTSREALDRFTKALAEREPTHRVGHSPGRPRKAKTDRQAQIEAAEISLRKAGL